MRKSLFFLRQGSNYWRNSGYRNLRSSSFRVSLRKVQRSFSYSSATKSRGNMTHILKSPYDKKNYREITLSNGLTALLISDMDQITLRPFPIHQHHKAPAKPDDSSSGTDTDGTEAMLDDDECIIKRMSSEEESTCDIPQVSGLLTAKARETPVRMDKKAAAALCVGVGSFCDPEDIPGFAHFLEHMVFMGSKKFKKENAFDDFTSKHGGESNAWTDAERTVFFFDIHKYHFHKALDMFAQFFISPLFGKSSVDREIMAVDNEFQMIKYNDNDRYHQVLGTLAFPYNPMCRFLCGNQLTLKTIPRERGIEVYGRLRDFFRRIYSAHYMTLVVQAPESLDDLESLVHSVFDDVPNNGLLPPSMADYRDPFVPRNFHKLIKVVPVEDCQRLDLCWPLPPLYKRFKCKPLEYLGSLIAHEGLGSVMSCLRKRGLALSLSGGNHGTGFDQNKLWSGFTVTIILTDAGMEGVCEVISIVFEYVTMLQLCGPQAWFYKELRDIENIKFRFRDELDPIEHVEQVAENMQLYPLEHYLTGRSLILNYDAQVIRECLSYLTPLQASVTLWSKEYEGKGICDQLEPWFGTQYSITDIPEEWNSQWQEKGVVFLCLCWEKGVVFLCLCLEKGVVFLCLCWEKGVVFLCLCLEKASEFDLLETEGASEVPVQVLDNEFGRMWFKKDKKFKMPKGFIMLHLMTPVVASSVENSTLCDLYISVMEQQLLETLYAASLTGYEFSMESVTTGLVIHMEGFSHKLAHVLELFVTHIAEFTITPELFNAVKSQLKKTYYNEMIKAYEFAKVLRYSVTEPMNQPIPDRYIATDTLTMPMLEDFHKQIMDALYIEGLMTGNFLPQHAVEVGSLAQNKLCRQPLPADKLPVKRVLKLPKGDLQCRVKGVNAKDTNSCINSFYQYGPGTIHEVCLNELLVERMKEPVFNKLRTEHQLGYSVFCQHLQSNAVLGFAVTVETHANKFGMSEVEQHISDFLENFKKTMNKMSKSCFIDLVNSAINSKQVEDTQLGDETARYWQEVLERTYIFDRQEKEVETLRNINQSELKAWYQNYMDPSHRHISFQMCQQQKLTVAQCVPQVEGCKDSSAETMEVDKEGEKSNCVDDSNHFLQALCEGSGFISNINVFRQSLRLYPITKLTS
ncbi:hypothetical protein ACOMHN_009187 [Nucella lapillus]